MNAVQGIVKFVRRLGRYDARYFRHKAYDSPLRGMIESQIDCWRLKKHHPDLHEEFLWKREGLTGRLSPFHEEYVSEVSSDIMAASLELSVLLLFLCETLRPKRILDLGSGFSSFVFRHYARSASPTPVVWSVDDSPEWLEKTRSYLASRDVDAKDLYLWGELIRRKPDPFDLILCDLGGFDFRKDTFETVLGLLGNCGALVIDDMHSAEYGLHVRRIVAESGTIPYSMRRHTHDKFGRYSMLVFRKDTP